MCTTACNNTIFQMLSNYITTSNVYSVIMWLSHDRCVVSCDCHMTGMLDHGSTNRTRYIWSTSRKYHTIIWVILMEVLTLSTIDTCFVYYWFRLLLVSSIPFSSTSLICVFHGILVLHEAAGGALLRELQGALGGEAWLERVAKHIRELTDESRI